MIDKENFREHYRFFDKEIVVEIINIFEEEYPERIEAITRFLTQENFTGLRKATHAFKGVIANFDADGKCYNLIKEFDKEVHQLEKEITDGRILTANESEKVFDGFKNTFKEFKEFSLILLRELAEIKKEYLS